MNNLAIPNKAIQIIFVGFTLFFFSSISFSQTPIYSNVLVSDVGLNNNIGRANTSRNVVVSESGEIYVVFVGSMGIRVAKSIDRGQSFLPSVPVFAGNNEPEIIVNKRGDVFVSWVSLGRVYISRSIDGGATFEVPVNIGTSFSEVVHMAVFDDAVYIIDRIGANIYINNNRGEGTFNHIINSSYVYADIRADQNGVLYIPSDDPALYLSRSDDGGATFTSVPVLPRGRSVYFSSYALSDGPCGTFIFVAGGSPTVTDGFKINVETGVTTPIVFGNNSGNTEGRTLFADNRGTLVDGYKSPLGQLFINISYDQGQTFSTPILVANGVSHNVTRNPFHEDIDVVFDVAGQVYLNVYDGILKNIKITNNNLPAVCPGDSFNVPYELAGTFNATTEFVVYLSDATGSFENKTEIGSIISNTNGQITCTIPSTKPFSELYRVIIESATDCAQSNIVDLKIGSVDINTPTTIQVCDDDNDGFYAFDTSNIESEVLGSLSKAGLSITYFDGNGNALPSPLPNPYINTIQQEEEILIRVSKTGTSCFAETSLKLQVYNTPIVNTPQTLFSCNEGGGIATFNTSNIQTELIGNQTNLTVYYFDGNGNALPSPLPTSYNNIIPWSETIQVKVENSVNANCFVETSFNLEVNTIPEINLESKYYICNLEPSRYISVRADLDYYEWAYQDGTIISNTFEANLVNEGNYTLHFGTIQSGILCQNSTEITLVRSVLPSIEQVKTKELSDDNYIEIIATGDGDFEYSIDGVNFQDSPIFSGVLGGVYTAKIRDKDGCGEDFQKVIIIDYPKYFTPNGDGFNDVWQIKGIEKYPLADIRIFDRYGKFIKQIKPSINDGWDGTFNGKTLPSSDYWFTANLDGNKTITKHFTLKR